MTNEIICKTFDSLLSREILWKSVIIKTQTMQNKNGKMSEVSPSSSIKPEKTK